MLSYVMVCGVIILLGMMATASFNSLCAGNLWAGAFILVLPLILFPLATHILEIDFAHRLVQQLKANKYGIAELTCIRHLGLLKKFPMKESRQIATAQMSLGIVRLHQGKFDSALEPLREAVRMYSCFSKPAEFSIVSLSISNLALACFLNERVEEAEILAKQALHFYDGDQEKVMSSAAFSLILLGQICTLEGRCDEAEDYLKRSEAPLQHNREPFLLLNESIENARICRELSVATLRCKQERITEARSVCHELLNRTAIDQYLSISALDSIHTLVNELIDHNEQKLAERFLEHAYAQARRHPDHPDTSKILGVYATLLQDTGRSAEVEDLRRWVRPVLPYPSIGSSPDK
jgi:tetratricopeptide (TPR) repeat protein